MNVFTFSTPLDIETWLRLFVVFSVFIFAGFNQCNNMLLLLLRSCRLKSIEDSWYSFHIHIYVDWTCLLYNSFIRFLDTYTEFSSHAFLMRYYDERKNKNVYMYRIRWSMHVTQRTSNLSFSFLCMYVCLCVWIACFCTSMKDSSSDDDNDNVV